jgi:hypothetical protein
MLQRAERDLEAAGCTVAGHDMMRRLVMLSRYGFLVTNLLDERSKSSELQPQPGPNLSMRHCALCTR